MTPSSRKARGLIAYLALSGERWIERDALQTMFWPDRMPAQARASLKQELTSIRKSFGDAAVQPLETDGGPVRLTLSQIHVDAFDAKAGTGSPRLLEGIGLYSPPFQKWLQAERHRLAATAKPLAGPQDGNQSLFVVAIEPDRSLQRRGGDEFARRMVVDMVARLLDHSGLASVVHLTPTMAGAGPSPLKVDFWLDCTAIQVEKSLIVSARLLRSESGVQVWSSEETVDQPEFDPVAYRWIGAHFSEQILEKIWQNAATYGPEHSAAASALLAIQRITTLSPTAISEAEAALERAGDALPSSTILAWTAYLTAFQLEKRNYSSVLEIRDRARYYSAKALEADKTNPLTRALVAHAHSFVLNDLTGATELVSPVNNFVSHNAMLADTVGMLHFYNGQFDQALEKARTSCVIGKWSPFRYAFTTCMATCLLMLGDFRAAVRAGELALAQHPPGTGTYYEPALRTLAAAYSYTGDRQKGMMMLGRLQSQSGRSGAERFELDRNLFPNQAVYMAIKTGIDSLYA